MIDKTHREWLRLLGIFSKHRFAVDTGFTCMSSLTPTDQHSMLFCLNAVFWTLRITPGEGRYHECETQAIVGLATGIPGKYRIGVDIAIVGFKLWCKLPTGPESEPTPVNI